MLIKEKSERNTLEMISLEGLVPQDHLLRKIDCAVDFTHIYDFVEDLYCADNGRPSVDPVVLFKMVLIQHLYGIPSLRRTVEEINMNIAYRWFLGYLLNEPVPHFATISYNFRHRFREDTIEQVFTWILFEAQKSGYLSPEVVFMDGTHIKANANINKKMKKAIPSAAKAYEQQLMKEINEDRMAHGKKPFDRNSGGGESREREITVSTTDPESGMFRKGDHKHCFAYEAHTVCDRHNFILDTVVTSGNVHDSVAFDALYERVTRRFPQIRIVTMDAGYKTPWICKRIIDDGRLPSLPYKRPMTKEGFHEWYKYVYDEYLDIVICPEYKSLLYSTTNHKKESAYNVYIRCTPQTVKEPLLCKSVAEVLFKTFMS
ncbi:MAG: IS1182 family transposase [Lachnospiraceae bacterium]|nr:IS1182 family transposase [Lachnospiraceae bacterium]